jgi:DNA adenine methylase
MSSQNNTNKINKVKNIKKIQKNKESNKEDINKEETKELINKKDNTEEDDNDIINYTKPILKWVGGKTQIIDKVMDKFPKNIYNYHELFVGGGSVLLALLDSLKHKKIKVSGAINAYDLNETLINLYINIQKNHQEVIDSLKKITEEFNKLEGDIINRKPKNLEEAVTSQESYYYWIRSKFNDLEQEEKNKVLGTAYFIFLNKTCFRGVYREGPNGFNVPFGHYKNPSILDEVHIKKVSKLIEKVNFIHSGFDDSFKNNNINKTDFLYLDPPYAPENETSFVGYTSDGFNLEKHKLLFKLCKDYNFLMSNADVKLVRDSFNDKKFTIESIDCRRAINSKKPDAKTKEVLIKSF